MGSGSAAGAAPVRHSGGDADAGPWVPPGVSVHVFETPKGPEVSGRANSIVLAAPGTPLLGARISPSRDGRGGRPARSASVDENRDRLVLTLTAGCAGGVAVLVAVAGILAVATAVDRGRCVAGPAAVDAPGVHHLAHAVTGIRMEAQSGEHGKALGAVADGFGRHLPTASRERRRAHQLEPPKCHSEGLLPIGARRHAPDPAEPPDRPGPGPAGTGPAGRPLGGWCETRVLTG